MFDTDIIAPSEEEMIFNAFSDVLSEDEESDVEIV